MNDSSERSEKSETILVVEDDSSLAEGLQHNLGFEGYTVLLAADGEQGLRVACDEEPDLIILDLMLPKMAGFDVLRAVRERGLTMPLIILSARSLEEDKIIGLELGADDYVTKPFSLRELLARVEAALRRVRIERRPPVEPTKAAVTFGDVRVFTEEREVFRGTDAVHLTRREFDLLLELITHPNRPQTRETLLVNVWGLDYDGTERTVDNFVRNLRRKLERDPADPQHLQTVHGVGYRFVPNQ